MIAILLLIAIYCTVIILIIIGFNRLEVFKNEDKEVVTPFSILIPFKDEAKNLPELFKSLSELKYPKTLFEVFLINDHSEDHSVTITEAFIKSTQLNITLIHSNQESTSPKKEAITKAISLAQNDWIITTDADCTFKPNWLKDYNNFIAINNAHFIAGPVTYTTKNRFFEAFQLLDFSSLIGVTIGLFGLKKPIMCNGANLAYTKTLFKKVNGFEGNRNIASGDDVFLLEKAIVADKTKVHYLKNNTATVYTRPVKNITALISQRKRWASKTGQSNNLLTKLLGLLVLSTNGLFIITLLNLVIPIFSVKISLIYVLLKIIVDGILIYKSLRFFNQENHFKFYVLSAFIYPFFSTYIALQSLLGGYQWKNRTYKR